MTEKSIKPPAPIPAIIPTFMNVSAMGLLAGLSFGVQCGLVPAFRHLDATAYVTVMQAITPTFMRAVIPLMVMGFITFIVRLVRRSECAGANYWVLASFAFFIAGALITVLGHFPINDQIMASSPQNPPAMWIAWRDRWNELNFWRFAVAQCGFIAALVPLILSRRGGRRVPAGQAGALATSTAGL